MTISSILGFLVGRRDAIERIAACPRAVFVGLLFVLSAGLACEYDGEDLLAEPYHVVLPLAASLATSFMLYSLLSGAARCWKVPGHWWLGYARFLGLYWMTALLAWVYAIPVERRLTPYEATIANLSLLGVVSLWRVALMIRVVAVLFQARVWRAAMVVLLFADIIVVPATGIVALSTISVMGGVRLSDSEALVAAVSKNACAVGLWTLPIWFFGSSYVLGRGLLTWPNQARLGIGANVSTSAVSRGAWMLTGGLLVLGIVLLPATQGEQRRRRKVETLFAQDRVPEAVALMASFERDDFPPHWDPPPGRRGFIQSPRLFEAIVALNAQPAPDWLSATYRNKLDEAVDGASAWNLGLERNSSSTSRFFVMLESLPHQTDFAKRHARSLIVLWRHLDDECDIDASDRLRTWLSRNGVDISPHDSAQPNPTHRDPG